MSVEFPVEASGQFSTTPGGHELIRLTDALEGQPESNEICHAGFNAQVARCGRISRLAVTGEQVLM